MANRRIVTINGLTSTIPEMAAHFGIDTEEMYSRIVNKFWGDSLVETSRPMERKKRPPKATKQLKFRFSKAYIPRPKKVKAPKEKTPARPRQLDCLQCGQSFLAKGRQVFCSKPCQWKKAAAANKKPPSPRPEEKCAHCGELFAARTSTHQFCSDKCGNSHRNPPKFKDCPICEGSFRANTPRKYCSPKCSKEACRIQELTPVEEYITSEPADCPICHGAMPLNRPISKIYCSKKCAKIRHRRKDNLKRKTSPHHRVKDRLSGRLRDLAIKKGFIKSVATASLLGCSTRELAAKLEALFTNGMTWDTYGVTGWHIDHIIPCERFDLSQHEHQKVCFNWRNLRPLWGVDNWTRQHRMDFDDRLNLDPDLFAMAQKIGVRL